MAHYTQRNLTQVITYWAPASDNVTNDFGHASTSAGVLIKGRWETKTQQVRKLNGEEVVSDTVVFVDRDVEISGFLMLGDYEGLPVMADAQEVQAFRMTPDLRNLGQERRAFL